MKFALVGIRVFREWYGYTNTSPPRIGYLGGQNENRHCCGNGCDQFEEHWVANVEEHKYHRVRAPDLNKCRDAPRLGTNRITIKQMKYIRIIETGMGEESSKRVWTHKTVSTESESTITRVSWWLMSPRVQGGVEFESGDDEMNCHVHHGPRGANGANDRPNVGR
jgi:hypothetical protein